MLGRSNGNHQDWLFVNAIACVFLRFSFTQRTQRKRLRLNGNRALGYTRTKYERNESATSINV